MIVLELKCSELHPSKPCALAKLRKVFSYHIEYLGVPEGHQCTFFGSLCCFGVIKQIHNPIHIAFFQCYLSILLSFTKTLIPQ